MAPVGPFSVRKSQIERLVRTPTMINIWNCQDYNINLNYYDVMKTEMYENLTVRRYSERFY